MTDKEPQDRLTLWQVMTSSLAAALGIQRKKHHERDFAKGTPGQFIAVGIIFVVVFILAVVLVVNIVLSAAGVS